MLTYHTIEMEFSQDTLLWASIWQFNLNSNFKTNLVVEGIRALFALIGSGFAVVDHVSLQV